MHQTDTSNKALRRISSVQRTLVDRLFISIKTELHHTKRQCASNKDITAADCMLLVSFDMQVLDQLASITRNRALRPNEWIHILRIIHLLCNRAPNHNRKLKQPHRRICEDVKRASHQPCQRAVHLSCFCRPFKAANRTPHLHIVTCASNELYHIKTCPSFDVTLMPCH